MASIQLGRRWDHTVAKGDTYERALKGTRAGVPIVWAAKTDLALPIMTTGRKVIGEWVEVEGML